METAPKTSRKRKGAAVADAPVVTGRSEDIVTLAAGGHDLKLNIHQPLPIKHLNVHRLYEYLEKMPKSKENGGKVSGDAEADVAVAVESADKKLNVTQKM